MSRAHKPSTLPDALPIAQVDSLNHDGQGVARINGKAVFIDGGLAGEQVTFRYVKKHKHYDIGKAVEILHASPERVEPACGYFGVCGGCSLQHLSAAGQLAAKQQVLQDNLTRIGKVVPEHWLDPLTGPVWGYRRKARLGVRVVEKKGGVLIGFREKRQSLITPLASCEVLHPRIAQLLPALKELISGLAQPNQVPQIEVAVGDGAAALVFRCLQAPTREDLQRLRDFGAHHTIHIYLQSAGPDSVQALWPDPAVSLSYRLPAFELELFFHPTDFIQVNAEINQRMITHALELLAPQAQHKVLDLFCGVGNFSLPLARRAGRVLGIEAHDHLVEQARANARHNGLQNVEFHTANLYAIGDTPPWGSEHFDLWLLDPPRTGALDVIQWLPETGRGPQRIVYVSCNPSTLARDSDLLVRHKGYRLQSVGIMDMFPQTSHVESLAVFEKLSP